MTRNNDAEREARNKANQMWAVAHLADMDESPMFEEGLAELNPQQLHSLRRDKDQAKDPDKKLKDNIKTLIILAVLVAALYALLSLGHYYSTLPAW